MRILLLRAHPRADGFTRQLTDLFASGVRAAGGELTDIDLCRISMERCEGCFTCWLVTPGRCRHRDDVGPILDRLIDCDVMACAAPIYVYGMSAAMKTFIERLLPLARPGLESSRAGRLRNRLHRPERWAVKSFISIVSGALRSPESYQPTNQMFQLLADSLDMSLGGQLTRPESFLLQFEATKPKTVRMVREAFVRAGREAATQGRLEPETLEQASLPLAPDAEHYRIYANAYWETATRVFTLGGDLDDVRDAVLCEPAIVMREMARCVDPTATARVRAVLQFDLEAPERHYRITIDRGACEFLETTTERPDLRVRCEGAVWGRIFTRRLDARSAIRSGQLRLEGDKTLFTRLDRFFPPPSQ